LRTAAAKQFRLGEKLNVDFQSDDDAIRKIRHGRLACAGVCLSK
jgi:hypothetical protein